MSFKTSLSKSLHFLRMSLVTLTIFQIGLGGTLAAPLQAQDRQDKDDRKEEGSTETPIKHVIVLIGENRTFDHLFATYVPKSGESVKNLLSEAIVNANGTPGPKFMHAQQFQAIPPFKPEYFSALNSNEKTPYTTLPEPTLNFSPSPATGEPPPFPAATPLALLGAIEPSLEPADLPLLGRSRISGPARVRAFQELCRVLS